MPYIPEFQFPLLIRWIPHSIPSLARLAAQQGNRPLPLACHYSSPTFSFQPYISGGGIASARFVYISSIPPYLLIMMRITQIQNEVSKFYCGGNFSLTTPTALSFSRYRLLDPTSPATVHSSQFL
jgi:hypothetical protein